MIAHNLSQRQKHIFEGDKPIDKKNGSLSTSGFRISERLFTCRYLFWWLPNSLISYDYFKIIFNIN